MESALKDKPTQAGWFASSDPQTFCQTELR